MPLACDVGSDSVGYLPVMEVPILLCDASVVCESGSEC